MINPQLISYFIDEFFASSLFIISILAITDKKNNLQQPFIALFIGLTLLTIGTSYGYHSGFAINPARDLWPRIFTAIAGWGWQG
jgi:glycerol uptake facilitator-like aquaporin